MTILIQRSAQLAGLSLILKGPFAWGSTEQVIEAVMACGGTPVTRPVYPRKTIAILGESRLGKPLSKPLASCIEQGVWVMVDRWLKDVLELGVRPSQEMTIRDGIALQEGCAVLGRSEPYPALEMIKIPAPRGYYMDRYLDFINHVKATPSMGF